MKRQHNSLNLKGELIEYSIHYFDKNQRVSYIENWQSIQDERFDAKLTSAERLEYDNSGRLTLNVTYLQSKRRTIKKAFQYDATNLQKTLTEIIKGDALWDE